MTALTTIELAHCLGRSVAVLAKLRIRYSFPRPHPKGTALLYDATRVRAWIVANQDSLSPTHRNEKALDLNLFDERLAMILARKRESV